MEALEGEFIRAVSAFLVACPEADPLHLAARLEEVAPTKLLNRLRRESQQVSNSKAEAARLVLTEIYNRKTRKTHQVSWSHGAERPAAEA